MGFNAISAIKGAVSAHPKSTKAVLVGTGVAGVALGVTACVSSPPTDAKTVASNLFHPFDKNHDSSIAPDEATIEKTRYGREDNVTFRFKNQDGSYTETGTTKQYEQTYDNSVDKIRSAAGGADAIASWQEIGDFALKNFDKADKEGVKDGMLDGKEQRKFKAEYGEKRVNFGTAEQVSSTVFFRQVDSPTFSSGIVYSDKPNYDSGPIYDGGPIYDDGPIRDDGPVYDDGPVRDEGPSYGD
jgi:hypothetical protein